MGTPTDANNWTADQVQFIRWLAYPKRQRKPKTQKALAAELGVDEGTLSDWKRLPGFLADVTATAKALLKDDLPDIFAALGRQAKAGDVPAIKLALEVTGAHIPKQAIVDPDGKPLPIVVLRMDVDEL